jgi:UDP-glucose/GDP-mannose dehydrogenase family, NAD binding domain
MVFISVNTPTKTSGVGAGRAANIKVCQLAAHVHVVSTLPSHCTALRVSVYDCMNPVHTSWQTHNTHSLHCAQTCRIAAVQQNCELCARKIAEVATSSKVVVEKSTVPVRTADAVRRVLMCNEKGIEFQVHAQHSSMSWCTSVSVFGSVRLLFVLCVLCACNSKQATLQRATALLCSTATVRVQC